MNFFKIIDLIILFVVIYLLVMIGRWFVLPHLKVFPNIPPQWLWTSIVNVIMYIFNAIFHYILMALLIIYILWIIIKKFVPNFPIPFKKILLRLPPFYPLEKAGVLPLFDNVRKILFSRSPMSARVKRAGQAIGGFLASSTMYVFQKIGVNPPTSQYSKGKKGGKAAQEESVFTAEEEIEIQDAYLQCIEQSTIPITPDMPSSEKSSLNLRNQQNTLICKVNQMQLYARFAEDKLDKEVKKFKKKR